jgi:excisionase family DNA binding protein
LSVARRYASLDIAAEYFGVTRRTIERYVADGRINAYRLGPRLIRLDLDEFDALLTPKRTPDTTNDGGGG